MAEQLQRKNICPLLREPCLGADCKWYLQLTGTDPQDPQKAVDGWDCAIVWQVQAALDVRKAVTGGLDGVQKATESFRNQSLKAAAITATLLAQPPAPMKVIGRADG